MTLIYEKSQTNKRSKETKMRIIPCVLFLGLVLSSCTQSPSLSPSPFPAFSETPLATSAGISTPTPNYKTIILTPDDLFSLPGLDEWSTPNSDDFCEHLPSPEIISNANNFSNFSGRFVLCIYEWIQTAIDLDTGSLVSTDDPRGDIVMFSGRFWTSEKPDYGVSGWNNAYLTDAYVLENYTNHAGTNHLSSAYCESMVQGRTDTNVIDAEAGAIACIRTTEGKVALIRVERIYPANTLSVEFSFAILNSVIATPVITQTASLTPGPSPTATNTPTDQELLDDLDKRTQSLFHEPASVIIDFLLEIQDSVKTENKEKLASLVYYPITIYTVGKNNNMVINNASEFIAKYDEIITPEWKEVVLAQEPARLFINWQGVMVHRGELWFTSICLDQTCQSYKYYIITINQDTDW